MSRRLLALVPGVFLVAGAPWTWHAAILAATLAAGPDACASHRAAAAVFGFPGFARRELEIVVPRGQRPRVPGVTVHHVGELPDHHQRVVEEIPTTSVARTIFDLCGCVHPGRAERALDDCLARRLVTIPACWRIVYDLAEHGRPGTALTRTLLQARGHGYVAPASELERKMLRLLRDAGLPAPSREIDVGDADGWVGRVDLVYRDAKILIEVDSRLHHTALDDYERDRARDNRLVASGWRVLRFTADQIIRHPNEVARTVGIALSNAPRPFS
ncbi:MAG: endonuclease domain-containing protein [Acidimicrobiia bacterium]|nr:endonuclease domain-containing protein [Acidimicrobiia bacterium]